MTTHLSFYNNDTLLSDNVSPSFFEDFSIPANTNLIVAYDDDYQITCNMRVTAESNQSTIQFNYSADSAIFLVSSLQNHTNYSTVRCQISTSNFAKSSDNINTDIQNYLQTCNVNTGSSIDFSTIVTALNNISTALSSLTNLSNLSKLADLANIITAINNKDNQTDIVNELRYLFSQSVNENSYRVISGKTNLSLFKGNYSSSSNQSISTVSRSSFAQLFRNLCGRFSTENNIVTSADIPNTSKYFYQIVDKLTSIETKLEQNLPFTTLNQVDVVTDYTQVVKGVSKSE